MPDNRTFTDFTGIMSLDSSRKTFPSMKEPAKYSRLSLKRLTLKTRGLPLPIATLQMIIPDQKFV